MTAFVSQLGEHQYYGQNKKKVNWGIGKGKFVVLHYFRAAIELLRDNRRK